MMPAVLHLWADTAVWHACRDEHGGRVRAVVGCVLLGWPSAPTAASRHGSPWPASPTLRTALLSLGRSARRGVRLARSSTPTHSDSAGWPPGTSAWPALLRTTDG